ncbi:hypothetical protein E4U35_003579 [Claviceps purpurea]|nr:hypothetical protein E4U35_003579 [Claviceps purpurea]KAG6215502.1 hypothetical protein E4U34_005609 [Claviceps purpurea]KAG6240365.1 hypothetical protein E4U25_008064 [Claviceps purpurea]KAG6314722.1 hypothetical protein E4U44_001707 [Claviceps purpurea]
MPSQDLVLLTGATGMVGFRVLMRLLESGYFVRAVVRTQAGFDRISSLPCIRNYKSQLSSIVVPNITAPFAYYEAVKGAKFVVHVASPSSCAHLTTQEDFQEHIIRPAVQGTIGLLDAAQWVNSVKRVVITGCSKSTVSQERIMSGALIDEDTLDVDASGRLTRLNVYARSKALAFAAIQDFLRDKTPQFTVVNILPVFIIGRDDKITGVKPYYSKGTNSILMGPLLGIKNHITVMGGNSVHLDDVAELHVRALDENLTKGNETITAAAGPMRWSDCFEIVQRRFPKECAEGVFPFDDILRPSTSAVNVDNSKAKRLLGREFKTYEEQVVSVVEHYLELRGQRAQNT